MIRGYIYSKDDCPACRMTDQLATSTKWTKHNTSDDDKVRDNLRRQGYQQFPVIEVFGSYGLLDSWTGFRPERINFWNPRVDA